MPWIADIFIICFQNRRVQACQISCAFLQFIELLPLSIPSVVYVTFFHVYALLSQRTLHLQRAVLLHHALLAPEPDQPWLLRLRPGRPGEFALYWVPMYDRDSVSGIHAETSLLESLLAAWFELTLKRAELTWNSHALF